MKINKTVDAYTILLYFYCYFASNWTCVTSKFLFMLFILLLTAFEF